MMNDLLVDVEDYLTKKAGFGLDALLQIVGVEVESVVDVSWRYQHPDEELLLFQI